MALFQGLSTTLEKKQAILDLLAPKFEEMVSACIQAEPADPVKFLCEFLEKAECARTDEELTEEEKQIIESENSRLEELLREVKSNSKVLPASSAQADAKQNDEAKKAHAEASKSGNAIFPAFSIAARDAVAHECFKHDWSLMKLQELVSPGDKTALEEALRPNYYWICSLYRRLSTHDATTSKIKDGMSVFGINQRIAINLLDVDLRGGVNLLDKSHLTKPKAEFCFKEANMVPKDVNSKFAAHNDKGLVRYQFMEFLLRSARCKYPGEKLSVAADNVLKKLQTLIAKYSGDVKSLFEAGSSKEVGAAYEELSSKLKAIFKKAAKDNVREEVDLHNWSELLDAANVYVLFPGFQRNDNAYAFRLGLETRADEQYSNTFQRMSFLEFNRGVGAVMYLSESHEKGSCSPETLAKLLREFVKHASVAK